MTDTIRTISDLLTNLFEDGQVDAISAQDIRDFVVTMQSLLSGAILASDKRFGAKLDGITDDAAAINAAITAAHNAGGGKVVLNGTAGVKSPITIPMGVILEGVSSPGYFDTYDSYQGTTTNTGSVAAIRALAGFAGNAVVNLDNTATNRYQGLCVRDLVIDANNIANVGIAMASDGGYLERRYLLSNVLVQRAVNDGVYLLDTGTFILDRSVFTGCGRYGINFSWGTSDGIVSNCYIKSNGQAGIYGQDGDFFLNVIGGKIEENSYGIIWQSVNAGSGMNLSLDCNAVHFQHNSNSAIWSTSSAGDKIPLVNATGCVFDSNGYPQTGVNQSQIRADGGRVIADSCRFSQQTNATGYHVAAINAGKAWVRNATWMSAAATANTYTDGTSTVTLDGGALTFS